MPAGGDFVGCCGPDSTSCQNPSEPVATIGLCLADGRPIAVTVVRDCGGNTTQEGWLDLTTGVWTAGPPPEGVGACAGERPQFEVGQWCDLDADGQTIAPVLVEYEYGPEGQLVGVRTLTPAGDPYEVQGTLGLCPGADEDGSPPEPCRGCETITLCDTIDPSPGESGAEPVVVPFLRTICRDCDGTVTSVVDTELDGTTAYTVQGEAGACHPPQSEPATEESPPEPCLHCSPLTLCDTPSEDAEPQLLPPGETSGTLDNGLGWQMDCAGPDPQGQTGWWQWAGFPCPLDAPLTLTFDRPAAVTWAVRVGQLISVGQVVMPAGTEVVEIHPDHDWDPDTLTLSARPGAVPAYNSDAISRFSHPGAVELVFPGDTFGNGSVGRRLIGEITAAPLPDPTPFVRTVCHDCHGELVSTSDTTLDGQPYTPIGQVGMCAEPPDEPCVAGVQVLRLCDLNPDAAPDEQGRVCATPFLRHLVFGCDGQVSATRDTTLTGEDYSPVQVVDCGSTIPAMVELQWPLTSVEDDPDGTVGRDYVYTLTHPETGEVAQVRLSATSAAGSSCSWQAPPGPDNPPIFNNPTTYTYTLDDAARKMDRFALDFLDLDTFEGIYGLAPVPDAVQWIEGSGVWDGDRIDADVNNSVVRVLWNSPPETIRHSYANSGGGNACHAAVLAGVTMRPEGCCSCDEGGESPSEPQPCSDSSSLLLCDIPTDDDYTADAAAEDVTDQLVDRDSHLRLPGGVPAVWDSGEGTIPPDPDPSAVEGDQVYRMVAGAITPTGTIPACNAGTVVVTAALDITNIGPTDGLGYTGRVQLLVGGSNAASSGLLTGFPVGETQRVQVTARVPADDFAAGQVRMLVTAETFHGGPKGWTLANFAATYTVDMPEGGCETQFLRHIRRDCETGQIIDISDTTLDGQPYEVAGDVGQCEPVEQRELCNDTELVTLCDTAADGTVVPFLRRLVFDCYGQTTSATDLTLDGQPYEPTGQIGLCHTPTDESPGELCQVVDTFTTSGCDDLTEEPDGEIVCYTNVWGVDCDGQVSLVHTYRDDPAVAYTPVNPVPCEQLGEPTEQVVGVQALRLQLQPGQSWTADSEPLLQSVTATAVTGDGEVTDEQGTTILHTGESATWSVVKDSDQFLRGPLTITATGGVLTLNITRAVTS